MCNFRLYALVCERPLIAVVEPANAIGLAAFYRDDDLFLLRIECAERNGLAAVSYCCEVGSRRLVGYINHIVIYIRTETRYLYTTELEALEFTFRSEFRHYRRDGIFYIVLSAAVCDCDDLRTTTDTAVEELNGLLGEVLLHLGDVEALCAERQVNHIVAFHRFQLAIDGLSRSGDVTVLHALHFVHALRNTYRIADAICAAVVALLVRDDDLRYAGERSIYIMNQLAFV